FGPSTSTSYSSPSSTMSIPSSGSSTWCSAATTSSLLGIRTSLAALRYVPRPRDRIHPVPHIVAGAKRVQARRPSEAEETNLFAPLPGEEVMAVDEPDPVAAGAHDERMRPRAVRQKAHA